MGVYLGAKSEVSSIILTSFRQDGGGGVILPPPPPQNEPLKSPPRLGLKGWLYWSSEQICLQLKVFKYFLKFKTAVLKIY